MALPTIPAYALPTSADLPTGKVSWHLEPSRAAVLVHDMQEYFVGVYGDRPSPLPAVVSAIQQVLERARALKMPVVYTAQPPAQTPQQRRLLTDFWGPGLADEQTARVIAPLAPEPGDIRLTKWRYSAFQRSNLAELLAAEGRDQLVICGVYAHIGVQTTAVDAFMGDVQAFVLADAVADFSREHHDGALRYVAERCGRVLDTATALAELVDTSNDDQASSVAKGAA